MVKGLYINYVIMGEGGGMSKDDMMTGGCWILHLGQS